MTNQAETAPASGYPLRRILILIAAFAAPFVGYAQMALDWGLSPSEFSADGDGTLRVAGYAFSIWAVIYGWLIVYGVYQALPRTPETRVLRGLAVRSDGDVPPRRAGPHGLLEGVVGGRHSRRPGHDLAHAGLDLSGPHCLGTHRRLRRRAIGR